MPDDAADPLPGDLPEYVRGLLDPAAYPERPDSVTLIQTHISYVFLAGDVVYKTKKPVNFGFIDQEAAEARERHCHAEVDLNRRLAPDIYLDVVPVVRRPDGTFMIGAPEGGEAVDDDASDGEVVEYAVKMRRLPEDRTLEALIAAGGMPEELPSRLTARLVEFHEAARKVENDREFAGASAVRSWWERERGEAQGFVGGTWSEADAEATRTAIEQSLERDRALFDERLADGRVIEGHGDLLAKHVYVMGPRTEDLVIVDCIEFSDWFQFRYLDAGYDIAFLAMDLESNGRGDLGDELAGRYLLAAADETMGVLQPLHRAFRAFVRGKVESIGAEAAEVPAPQRLELRESAARYFRLAASYARRRAGAALVVLTGPSGTGKSTVGATLAGRIGAVHISSDVTRKRLAGLDPRASAEDAYRDGLYTEEMSERTYAEMRRRATEHLAQGRPVVLDATHARAEDRTAAAEVARAARIPSLVVELRLPEEVALERIRHRRQDTLATSDATPEIYRRQIESFDPISPAEGACLQLDATQPLADLVGEIAEALPPAT